jgi:hypothetical protein
LTSPSLSTYRIGQALHRLPWEQHHTPLAELVAMG